MVLFSRQTIHRSTRKDSTALGRSRSAQRNKFFWRSQVSFCKKRLTRTGYMCLMAKIPRGKYWECFMEITLPLRRESTPRQTTCLSCSYQTTTALTPVSMLRTMPFVIKRRRFLLRNIFLHSCNGSHRCYSGKGMTTVMPKMMTRSKRCNYKWNLKEHRVVRFKLNDCILFKISC